MYAPTQKQLLFFGRQAGFAGTRVAVLKCGSQLLVLHAFFYTLNILLALNEITQRWHRPPPLICAQF